MELIPNRLYFFLENDWNDGDDRLSDMVLNLDDLYQHDKVHKHFGPPGIKMIWKHCDEIDMRLQRCRKLIFLTNDMNDNLHIEQRTISAFLMTAYAVLRLGFDADTANKSLLHSMPARLAFFRDYHGDSSYKLNILDCMRGLVKGCKEHRWFTSYASTKFPQATSSRLDMNWVVPGLFIAFKDPTIKRDKEARGISKAVLRELKRCRMKVVVRLNGNDHAANVDYYGFSYNPSEFKQEKFVHYDIPFKDVNIPTVAQANQFVGLCERYGGKIAVHCHAGLGRTATMIGCHLIKNFGFDSRSVCAWLKICRRGSVMGPQHFFLDQYAREMKSEINVAPTTESTKIVSPMKAEIPITLSQTQPKMSRQPRKNNIIHIVPVSKTRATNQMNPMQKYSIESSTNVNEIKRTKLARSRQSQRTLSSDSAKKVLRPAVVTPNPSPEPSRTTLRVQPTPCKTPPAKPKSRPSNVKKYGTAYRTVSAKKIDTKAPKKTTTPIRTPSRPSIKKGTTTKSNDAIRSNIRTISAGRMAGKSNSWGQWSEQVFEGIITNSKSKLNGLVGNTSKKIPSHEDFVF